MCRRVRLNAPSVTPPSLAQVVANAVAALAEIADSSGRPDVFQARGSGGPLQRDAFRLAAPRLLLRVPCHAHSARL